MRLMTVQWLAVLALLAGGVGCSSSSETNGSQSGDRPEWSPPVTTPTGLLIEPGPAAEIGYRIGWASPIQLQSGQRMTSVTALGDVVIVIEEPLNTVTALRADDGEMLWKINLGSDLEQLYAPSRDGDRIFIHSGRRMFTVSKRFGEVQAVAALETPVASPAVYSAETRLAIMTGTNGRVFAHSVDNNFSRWRYDMSNRMVTPAVLAGRDVFVVDSGGTYAMLEIASGDVLWRNRTLGPVSAAPQIQGSEVIVASTDGKLYAMNRTTGRDTWQYLGAEQPLTASPVLLGRLIIQPLLPNSGIIAVDAIDGEELWRTELTARPVVTRQRDMLLHTLNQLVTLDLDDGQILHTVTTRPLLTVEPIGDDGGVILVSANGRLLKLSPI